MEEQVDLEKSYDSVQKLLLWKTVTSMFIKKLLIQATKNETACYLKDAYKKLKKKPAL